MAPINEIGGQHMVHAWSVNQWGKCGVAGADMTAAGSHPGIRKTATACSVLPLQ